MHNLFLIDGASGVWKTDLVNYVSHYLLHSTIVIKLSTRELRENETPSKLDLRFVSDEEFATIKPDYQYVYNEKKYGFMKRDVDNALSTFENVFLVVRNSDIVGKLRSEYEQHNVVPVFIYTDTNEVIKRLPKSAGEGLRKSAKQAFLDYLRNPELYDEVLVNGSSANDFYRLVNVLISRQTNKLVRTMQPRQANFRIMVSARLRAILGLVIGGLAAITIGFIVNMITQGEWSYWKYVSTLTASLLGLLLILLAVLTILGSDDK